MYIYRTVNKLYTKSRKRGSFLHQTVFIAEITGMNPMAFARFSPMHTNIQPTLQPLVPYTDPAHQAGGQASYFWSGARPDGSNPEAQRAESGGGVLGEGAA